MLAPNPDSQHEKLSLVQRIFQDFRERAKGHIAAYRESSAERKEAREDKKRFREEMKIHQRASYRPSISEYIYMFLDYDPTDIESGETSKPSLIGALVQWFYRVIWTRRIELGGFLFIVVIGLVCYLSLIHI